VPLEGFRLLLLLEHSLLFERLQVLHLSHLPLNLNQSLLIDPGVVSLKNGEEKSHWKLKNEKLTYFVESLGGSEFSLG